MFLNHYQLQEQPFGVTPDPRYTFFTSTHREALASLAYAVETGSGFSVMVAKPGMGKTTLLFRLLDYLQDRARTVFVFHTQCNSVDLMRYILADMKIKYSGKDLVEMHALLNQALLNEARLGRTVVVAIDESQNLSHEVLETIRLLSDFETPRRKLLQIILCGQPQLGHKLAHPDLVQLRQRITVLCRLSPLSLQEVNGYINHRLQVAGYPGNYLFTPEAVRLIFSESRGIPRVINTLCSGALSIGCALGRLRIDPEVVQEVLADLSVDSLLEQMANEQGGAEGPSPDQPAPPMDDADSYLRDAPLTQALAAALAIPSAKAAASERDELALLKAKDNAFMRVTAPPSAQLAPEAASIQTAASPKPGPPAQVAPPAPLAAASAANGLPAAPTPSGAKIGANPKPLRYVALWTLVSQFVKNKATWVVGSIFLSLSLLVITFRPGLKIGSASTIAPDTASANSLAASPARLSAAPESAVLPAHPVSPGRNASAPDPVVHVVQDNETLSGISIEYLGHYDEKVLQDVQKHNADLKDPDFLRVGQKVLLPAPSSGVSTNHNAATSSEGKP
jgi:type II secretory pathway predicted ATPase ExeA/LysM repeat protein